MINSMMMTSWTRMNKNLLVPNSPIALPILSQVLEKTLLLISQQEWQEAALALEVDLGEA